MADTSPTTTQSNLTLPQAIKYLDPDTFLVSSFTEATPVNTVLKNISAFLRPLTNLSQGASTRASIIFNTSTRTSYPNQSLRVDLTNRPPQPNQLDQDQQNLLYLTDLANITQQLHTYLANVVGPSTGRSLTFDEFSEDLLATASTSNGYSEDKLISKLSVLKNRVDELLQMVDSLIVVEALQNIETSSLDRLREALEGDVAAAYRDWESDFYPLIKGFLAAVPERKPTIEAQLGLLQNSLDDTGIYSVRQAKQILRLFMEKIKYLNEHLSALPVTTQKKYSDQPNKKTLLPPDSPEHQLLKNEDPAIFFPREPSASDLILNTDDIAQESDRLKLEKILDLLIEKKLLAYIRGEATVPKPKQAAETTPSEDETDTGGPSLDDEQTQQTKPPVEETFQAALRQGFAQKLYFELQEREKSLTTQILNHPNSKDVVESILDWFTDLLEYYLLMYQEPRLVTARREVFWDTELEKTSTTAVADWLGQADNESLLFELILDNQQHISELEKLVETWTQAQQTPSTSRPSQEIIEPPQLSSAEEIADYLTSTNRSFQIEAIRLQEIALGQYTQLFDISLDSLSQNEQKLLRSLVADESELLLRSLSPEEIQQLSDPSFRLTLLRRLFGKLRTNPQFLATVALIVENHPELQTDESGEIRRTILSADLEGLSLSTDGYEPSSDVGRLTQHVAHSADLYDAFFDFLGFDDIQKQQITDTIDAFIVSGEDSSILNGLTRARWYLLFQTTLSEDQVKQSIPVLQSLWYSRAEYLEKLGHHLTTTEKPTSENELNQTQYNFQQFDRKVAQAARIRQVGAENLVASQNTQLSEVESQNDARAELTKQQLYLLWRSLDEQERAAIYEAYYSTPPDQTSEIPPELTVQNAGLVLSKQEAQQPAKKQKKGLLNRFLKKKKPKNLVKKATNSIVNNALASAAGGAAGLLLPGIGAVVGAGIKALPKRLQKWVAGGLLAAIVAFMGWVTHLFLNTWGGFVGGLFGGVGGFLIGGPAGIIPGIIVGTIIGDQLLNPLLSSIGIEGGPVQALQTAELVRRATFAAAEATVRGVTSSISSVVSNGVTSAINSIPGLSATTTLSGTVTKTIATATGLTAAATPVVVSYYYQTNLLQPLPTITDQGEISKYLSIEKTAEPGTDFSSFTDSNFPETTVQYSITVSADKGYDIALYSVEDTLTTRFNPELRPDASIESRNRTSDFFGVSEDAPLILAAGDSVQLGTYEETFTNQFLHSNVTNTIELTFTATGQPDAPTERQTAKTAEVVCFGECPQFQNGCWPADGWVQQTTASELGTHNGIYAIDIRNEIGTPIFNTFEGSAFMYATGDGLVPQSGPVYGNHMTLTVNPPNDPLNIGFKLVYGHMHAFSSLFQGSGVPISSLSPGENIGFMGISGLYVLGPSYDTASNSHLHYELRTLDGNSTRPAIDGKGLALENLVPPGEMVLGQFVRTCYTGEAQAQN